ncbi:cytochrome-c peroxidase [Archangium sp.]|uniref:cytochrome-c peroxidase n=1 Tax=Archangium sp. TaxID=1872627 RepID=UPI00286CAFB8|nr:cytochrome-c peroxidase [Archangium sp.]
MVPASLALVLWGALSAAPLQPLRPPATPSSDPQVVLGRRLFFDPRLSGDGKRSCASCHDPRKRFSDGQKVALGRGRVRLKRNTRTSGARP